MIAYVDASVILRIVLGRKGRGLAEWRSIKTAVTSDLAQVECLRTLDRFRLAGQLADGELARCREAVFRISEEFEMVGITRAVLTRASQPFPSPLGILDAIHLATALLWKERERVDLVMATHDAALATAARSLGFSVLGS